MDVKMASEYLHVSRSLIYKWVSDDFIPHERAGKLIFFIRYQIDEWVSNGFRKIEDIPTISRF
jgi:excisionase family DNA binding protein